MPWKEATAMSSRHEFVLLALKPGANFSELCFRFGISRKSGYKWLERYRAMGVVGLEDRSRRPLNSPFVSDAVLEAQVMLLHERFPYWGGRKLKELLPQMKNPPHHSTIDAILHRNGKKVEGTPHELKAPMIRFEHEAPNLLWQMDFKGHFALTDSRAGRCHPLTVLDDHSRFCVCLEACSDETAVTVRSALTKTFERNGLPERITADNGAPWGTPRRCGLTQIEVWLIRLGIRLSHSTPFHPQTQGKDERFHRTLKLELLNRRAFNSIEECQHHFDSWRTQYNEIRPHQALGQDVPISRYRASGRQYKEPIEEIEYLPDDILRTVNSNGEIRFKGRIFYIGTGLQKEKVALREATYDGQYEVYFCHHRVKTIDLVSQKVD